MIVGRRENPRPRSERTSNEEIGFAHQTGRMLCEVVVPIDRPSQDVIAQRVLATPCEISVLSTAVPSSSDIEFVRGLSEEPIRSIQIGPPAIRAQLECVVPCRGQDPHRAGAPARRRSSRPQRVFRSQVLGTMAADTDLKLPPLGMTSAREA